MCVCVCVCFSIDGYIVKHMKASINILHAWYKAFGRLDDFLKAWGSLWVQTSTENHGLKRPCIAHISVEAAVFFSRLRVPSASFRHFSAVGPDCLRHLPLLALSHSWPHETRPR